jgi:predicted molibdopterin-dependent oxidoreductase YjgC
LGVDPTASHEGVSFLIKRRLRRGLALVVIDGAENPLAQLADAVLTPKAGSEGALLAALAGGKVSGEAVQDKAAAVLAAARQVVVVHNPALSAEAAVFAAALQKRGASVECLALGGAANSRYAAELGLADKVRPAAGMFLALGDEAPSAGVMAAARQADFLVLMASHASDLDEHASVILPVEDWSEMNGHFINLTGRLQESRAALQQPAETRPGLETLQALAAALERPLTVDWRAALPVVA